MILFSFVLFFDFCRQLGSKIGKFGANVFQDVVLVDLDGEGNHFGGDGGAVAIFVGALGFFDGLYGKGGEVAFFLEDDAAVGQDTPKALLGTDDLDCLFGLEERL